MRFAASACPVRRRFVTLLAASALAAGVAGCGKPSEPATDVIAFSSRGLNPATAASGSDRVSMPALTGQPLRPDVLVSGLRAVSATQIRQVAALTKGAVAFASGTLRVGSTGAQVASVDPLSFRRFAASGTAESTAVWQVVASGGIVASHQLANRLHLVLGNDMTVTGLSGQPLHLRLGALATTGIPGTDLIVDRTTGIKLGLTAATAVLLNAGSHDPVSLAAKARKVAGTSMEVDLLSAPANNPVAFLTGSRAARAFGAFSYKYYPDGTIVPDARWVDASIVEATVPILGRVTCHRLMIPQLRGALTDVVTAGLSSSLHTYNGCYVPRFIERDPSHAISLHTWGIAIDLDSASNYRGIKGTMDPRVVDIFKRWGFRWGGDWSYSDPMHFELGALLTSSQTKKHKH